MAIFSWKMRNVLKQMKNQFYDFYFLRYSPFFAKNSQNLSSLLTLITNQKYLKKMLSQKMRNVLKTNAEQDFRYFWFLVFEIWLILCTKFQVNWWLEQLFENLIKKR